MGKRERAEGNKKGESLFRDGSQVALIIYCQLNPLIFVGYLFITKVIDHGTENLKL